MELAILEHNEDILLDLWSKSQSELSFDKWKAKIKKGNKRSTSEGSNVTGKDLARL